MTTDQAAPATRPGDLSLTRIVRAPRAAVWRAWSEAERVAPWWGPHGITSVVSAWELRPGGAIRIDMHAPDGSVYPMSGSFREVAAPERLVFVGGAQLDAGGSPLFEVMHTVTLAELDGGRTAVTVHARVLWAREGAGPHLAGAEAGWTQQLERLASHVETGEGAGAAAEAGSAGGGTDPAAEDTARASGGTASAAEAEGAARAGGGTAAASGPGSGTTFAVASDREIVATRSFDAPRWLVFLAYTQPEHLARWWGPRGFTNTVHALDVRPGGAWRITQRAPDGSEHPFEGVYREVVPPERLVHTQRYCVAPWSDHEALVTVTLDENGGGTALTVRVTLDAAADLDRMLRSGMEWGMRQGWDRLAEEVGGAAVGPATPWGGEIVASRVFVAPRDLLWTLWTEPQHVARWWGPRGFRTTIRSMDVRPGGAWRFVMHGPDGADYDNEMVFSEVSRPERLVYTHTVAPRFRQEVTFTDVGGARTRVAVRSVFERAEDVQPWAVEGMRQTLERYEAAIAAAVAG